MRGGLAVAGVVTLLGASAISGIGCTLLLDTSSNPLSCAIDSDCARFPNAACDNARKVCVPRQPSVDSGAPLDSPDGATGGTCSLSFDNTLRITVAGPDGGLRPLPDGGP